MGKGSKGASVTPVVSPETAKTPDGTQLKEQQMDLARARGIMSTFRRADQQRLLGGDDDEKRGKKTLGE